MNHNPVGTIAGVTGQGGRQLRVAAFAASLYAVALVFFLWPWPKDPAHSGINNGDLLLHSWSMAWVVHQATLDPIHLFDANMFWPRSGALSFTETLFPQSAMAAPVLWLGGGPLLAHNLVLFLSIVLSGVAAALFALRLTASPGAALIAGFAYAFCPFRFHHLVQIGIASYQWFPLVLLALWNLAARGESRATRPDFHHGLLAARSGRRGSLILLSVASVLQALSSGYYAVLLAFVVASATLCLARRLWRRGRLLAVIGSLAIAAVLAFIAGAPSVLLRNKQAVSRGVEGPIHWSAVPRSYLDPGPRVSALGLGRVIERTSEPLFPGFLVTSLALLGFVRTRHRAARGVLVSVGLVCAAMACGPVFRDLPWPIPGPFELVRRIPPADMIRVPSRFGIGAILAIDLMAALGFAVVERATSTRLRAPLLAAALGFMVIEMQPKVAHSITLIPPPPPYTAVLRTLPRGPVLEVPWRTEESAGLHLYWSTGHWQPLISGYGGFSVPDNFALAAMAQNFPTSFASRVLRCAEVRYVVVHGAQVSQAQVQRAAEFDLKGVTRIGRFGQDFLFALDPWAPNRSCPPEMPEVFRRRID